MPGNKSYYLQNAFSKPLKILSQLFLYQRGTSPAIPSHPGLEMPLPVSAASPEVFWELERPHRLPWHSECLPRVKMLLLVSLHGLSGPQNAFGWRQWVQVALKIAQLEGCVLLGVPPRVACISEHPSQECHCSSIPSPSPSLSHTVINTNTPAPSPSPSSDWHSIQSQKIPSHLLAIIVHWENINLSLWAITQQST